MTWDGRDPNGEIIVGTVNLFFDPPILIRENAIFVSGGAPEITGLGAIPNIEVKSDPYLITHSYDQISEIVYRIDQESSVTVKLLPPGVYDPASPVAITLIDRQLQQAVDAGGMPVDHGVEWLGYLPPDSNNILTEGEGVFTFAIEAESSVTGLTGLYRGTLQIRR